MGVWRYVCQGHKREYGKSKMTHFKVPQSASEFGDMPISVNQIIKKKKTPLVPQHLRKKLVYNKANELAQVFAEGGTEGSARGGRIFIDGDKIYSYGRHFIIAQRIDPTTYEFNTRRYSMTTSKQQSAVKSALQGRGYKIIEKEL